MKRLLTIILAVFSVLTISAETQQELNKRVRYKDGPAYIYRISLADKQGTDFSLDHPTRFLSRRSVERRRRQGLSLDSTDLPVSYRYRRLIESRDVCVIGQSRWQNTLLVRVKDTTMIQRVSKLACVTSCRMVWQSPDSVSPTAIKTKYHEHFEERDSVSGDLYGQASKQITMLKGQRLHNIGMRGEAMMIGIIDGGFKNVDKIPAFQHIDIRGHQDLSHRPRQAYLPRQIMVPRCSRPWPSTSLFTTWARHPKPATGC